MRRFVFVVAAAAALLPGAALAIEVDETDRATGDLEVFGLAVDSLQLGGGVGNYTGDAADDIGLGGAWDVRADLDMTRPLDLELAYVGGMNSIEQEGLTNYNIYTNGAQVALKLEPVEIDERFTPYVLGGFGLTRMSVAKDSRVSQDFQSDTAGAFPLAVGADVAISERFTLGARANWDVMFDNEVDVSAANGNVDRVGLTLSLGATNW